MITDWRVKRDNFDHRLVPGLVRDLWRGEPASLRLVSRDYNIVYRFESRGNGRYLRICHRVLHSVPAARQVLHFLRFLVAEGASAGEPVPSVNGAYLEMLAGGYFAAAQREAPGRPMQRYLLDRAVYEAWGESLGELHAASRRYQPDPDIPYEFPTVQRFWRNIEPAVRAMAPPLQRVYAELTDWMRRLPQCDYGLIHGDYRPGNVIWDGRTARAIDFDEPNYHWYIADVCRALLELYDQPLEERVKYRQAFLRGYLREHSIDDWWLTQLPYFAQHRALLMRAWDVQEGGSGSGLMKWALHRVGW